MRTTAEVKRGLRRLGTVAFLLPLLVLLARQVPHLEHARLVMVYGIAVLASTIAVFYLAYARYQDPSEAPARRRHGFPDLPADPTVSFLVAVKDEVAGIERCVRSIAASDYRPLQIVVVDDGSSDGTGELLDRLAGELDVTVLHMPHNVGKKRALVHAARYATGAVIAFTDSDCVVAPDALSRCVEALRRQPRLGAVSGHARALNAEQSLLSRAQDVWYEGQFRVAKAAEATFGSVTCVSGPLAVFRREAVYNYLPAWAEDRFLGGEFRFATDRQLTGYVLGQRWVGRRLKRRFADSPFVSEVDYSELSWQVGYVRSAKVWTVVPARLRPFLRQQVRWKKSYLRNLFFTGTFMWRRGPGPAALYYGHALWVAMAPFMAFAHLVWAPLVGLWPIPLLYLCGVLVKGSAWGLAYKYDNPQSPHWRYRAVMSLISATVLSWLLPYSLLTIRNKAWSRSAA